MLSNENKKDKTSNQRQTRRRIREKQWLQAKGWRSWEALHTALMNGIVELFVKGKNKTSSTIDTKQIKSKKK